RGAGLAPGARPPVPDRARPGRRPRPPGRRRGRGPAGPRRAPRHPRGRPARAPPATARGDLPAAANLLERAIALPPATDRTRLQLLTDLGEVLILNVETERARQVLDEALAAAERTGDRGLAAHATLGKLELRLDSPDRGPDRYRADVQEALSV